MEGSEVWLLLEGKKRGPECRGGTRGPELVNNGFSFDMVVQRRTLRRDGEV